MFQMYMYTNTIVTPSHDFGLTQRLILNFQHFRLVQNDNKQAVLIL